MANYYNTEDDEEIICPYCRKHYEPAYEDCYIGKVTVDCYTEEEKEYTCDCCGKNFILRGYPIWKYETSTIDWEATEEEAEEKEWI